MKKSIGYTSLVYFLITIFLISCNSSAPAKAPSLHGRLSAGGPIVGAELTLEQYQDEACATLAEGSSLTDSEKKQLESCTSDFANTTSDSNGAYEFSAVPPGWYRLIFTWVENKKPDSSLSFEFKNNFLIFHYQNKNTPNVYSALAQGEIFQFKGTDMIINFDY